MKAEITLKVLSLAVLSLISTAAPAVDDFNSGGTSAVRPEESTAGRQGSGTTDPSVGTTRGMSDTTARSHPAKAQGTQAQGLNANKDLFAKASVDKDHGMLVDAIRSAKLEKTLKSEGPFTVFAPTNAAFDELPEGMIDELKKTKGARDLRSLVSYHVVRGKYDHAQLKRAITESPNRRAELETLGGAKIYATLDGDTVVLQDTQGSKAKVIDPDQFAKNGVIHDIDRVVQPEGLARKAPMTRGPIFGE